MKTFKDMLPIMAGKKSTSNLILSVSMLCEVYNHNFISNTCKGLCPERFIMQEAILGDPPFVIDSLIHDPIPNADMRYFSDHYIKSRRWSENRDSVFALSSMLYHLYTGYLPWNIGDSICHCSRTLQKELILKARQTNQLLIEPIPYDFRELIKRGLTDWSKDLTVNDFIALFRDALYNAIRGKQMEEWMSEMDDKINLDNICEMLSSVIKDDFHPSFDEEASSVEVHNAEDLEEAINILHDNLCTEDNNDDASSFEEQKALYSRCGVLQTFNFQRGDGTNGLDKVAGMNELKESMKNEVLFPLLHPDMAQKYRLHCINGMLLYGPPGCGKTFFAEHFANEGAMSYCVIKASEISSSYIHGNQLLIQQLFDQAKRHAPCVVCLDEIDSMCPTRHDYDIKLAAETNSFLSELNNLSEHGIFVIGTTNRPDIIDPAVLRSGRFDKKIYVPAPDAQARKAIFDYELRDRPLADDIDYEELALRSENYIASDISAVVNAASLEAARNEELISQALLLKHILKTNPSLTDEMKKEYERIHEKMEDHRSCHRKQIGFC